MDKHVPEYESLMGAAPDPKYIIGIRLGRVSIILLALMPILAALPIIGLPIALLIAICAAAGAVLSRGRSVCAWIGVAAVGLFGGLFLLAMLFGQ